MAYRRSQGRLVAAASAAVALLFVSASPTAFANGRWTAAELLDPEQSVLAPPDISPFPLARLHSNGGLSFDLGGSEQRKLQLQLAEPLAFGTALTQRQGVFGATETTLGGTLGWLANDDLALSVSSNQSRIDGSFQALGSIHCENGILGRDSFTASNCYFIDQPDPTRLDSISLGADFAPTSSSRAGISLFRQSARSGAPSWDFSIPASQAAPLRPALNHPMLRQLPGPGMDQFDAEITGVDLEFQLGVSTNRAGDISLGLQLTRILDADLHSQYADAGFRDWSLSGPADSARVSFDWQKGAFSGGVESYYRAPIEFMNRSGIDSVTTFDVHFTWRTPWNANLSVGASNLLNSGTDDHAANDGKLVDPFESVYGRIPYVRYQQDL